MPCESTAPSSASLRTAWVERLLAWYAVHRRDLPWRSDPAPYRVWISEVMLQQTQVATVQPYFVRFMERFPTVATLAAADLQDLLMVWEGLGYYSRARNLHRAAGILAEQFHGELPRTAEQLRQLPGIGPYIAAAIASIAFGEPVPAVDGNVLRVLARFRGASDDIRRPRTREEMAAWLAPAMADADPSAFTQAFMELGALVCRPRHPDCAGCPLRPDCSAFAEGRTDELPVKSSRPPVPHHRVAVGLVWAGEKVLICRRAPGQMLGGLWEFPGGRLEPGETLEETVVREIREETGLAVGVTGELCMVRHAYSHFRVTITAFHCELVSDDLAVGEGRPALWVKPEELDRFPFPKANRRIIAALREARTREHPRGTSVY